MSDETEIRADEPVSRTMGERLRTPGGRLFLSVFGVWFILTLLLLAFGLWWPGATLPVTASDTQDAVKKTILVFSVAAAPVMALVWAIAYYSIRHWQHGGDTPPEDGPAIRGNSKITLTWIIVSAALTGFLLIWGLSELTATTTMPAGSQPLLINVTGQQWLWNFTYPQNGGISTPDLVVPQGRPVEFKVTSTDVIHSFWLPEMGIKVDANPLVTTSTFTTPSKVGTFNVRCAELCGLNHAYMQTTVTVMTPAKYNAWVLSQGGTPSQATATGASNG